MLTVHNATGTLPDDVLMRELRDNVDPAILPRIEGWYDAAATIEAGAIEEAHERGFKEAEEDAEPYKNAWSDFFTLWEDGYANGRWPGADADDEHLRAVMCADFERGAAAIAFLREITDESTGTAKSIRERARAVLEVAP